MIRPYDSKDLEDICQIENDSYPDPAPMDFLKEGIDAGKTWVYEIGGNVVGFLISTWKVEWRAPLQKKRMPYIFDIAVRPDQRKQGIASRLIDKFLDEFKEHDTCLIVSEHNINAKMLYERIGYIPNRLSKDYYNLGDSGIFMVRQGTR